MYPGLLKKTDRHDDMSVILLTVALKKYTD